MRTDIHSPTNFEPADYTYVGSFDNYPEPGMFVSPSWADYETDFGTVHALNSEHADYTAAHKLIDEHGAKIHFGHACGSQCDHCGARIRYVTIYRHKSGECIAVGNDCANGRFGCDSRREFDVRRLMKAAADLRERTKAMGQAVTFVDEHCPELSEWMLTPAANTVDPIFADLARKLIKFGSLSDKQVGFARKLLNEHHERLRNGGKTDRQVAWDVQKAQAEDCPKGRIRIIGSVIKAAFHESGFGETLKVTIKDDRGFVVWMTCPASLQLVECEGFQRSLERGDRVAVTVSVEPSDRDPKFGFGKRPAKPEILALVS